jgi:hypothetical protein
MNLILNSLKAMYPNAARAVAFHERKELKDLWEFARNSKKSPQEILNGLKQSAVETLEIVPGLSIGEIQEEMNTEDFAQYVQWKVGTKEHNPQ